MKPKARLLKKSATAAVMLGALGSGVLSSPAHAGIEEEYKNYRSARSSGMGGVLYTTGNFQDALFGNPARLAEVDITRTTILDLLVEANTNLITSGGKLSSLANSAGASAISGAADLIGENQHARLQLLAGGYYNPKFIGDLAIGFAFLTSAQGNVTINYTTDVSNQVVIDVGPSIGVAYPLLNKALTIGANMRLLYRASSEGTIGSLSFLTGTKLSLANFGKQGVGIDGDIGAYYKVPWELPYLRLSVGATIANLMKSHYDELRVTLIKGVGPRPSNNDRLINLGLRADFPDTWIMRAPLLSFEMQDIGSTTRQVSFYKRLHIGAETKVSRRLSVRTGFNQGYITAGLGLDLPVIKLDLATYGEELTGTAGTIEDRRILFRAAFEL